MQGVLFRQLRNSPGVFGRVSQFPGLREVEMEIGEIGDFLRAKNRKKIPVIMTKDETRDFLSHLKGEKLLFTHVMQKPGVGVRSPLDSL